MGWVRKHTGWKWFTSKNLGKAAAIAGAVYMGGKALGAWGGDSGGEVSDEALRGATASSTHDADVAAGGLGGLGGARGQAGDYGMAAYSENPYSGPAIPQQGAQQGGIGSLPAANENFVDKFKRSEAGQRLGGLVDNVTDPSKWTTRGIGQAIALGSALIPMFSKGLKGDSGGNDMPKWMQDEIANSRKPLPPLNATPAVTYTPPTIDPSYYAKNGGMPSFFEYDFQKRRGG